MTKRILASLALAVLCLSCDNGKKANGGGPAAHPGGSSTVTLKGKRIDVTVLATERERRRGTDPLAAAADGRGYLLAWPRERFVKLESEFARASFDVAFLDRSGKVVELQPLVRGEREGLMSRVEAACALLLAPGSLKAMGVQNGDAADLSRALAAPAQELPAMNIGGATAYVELALTETERQHGLMFRPRMSGDDGMLFAYPDEYPRTFWMMNTLIPLDIAFFRADGTLVNVNETPMAANPRAEPVPRSPSDGPARFVLEMNLGWFKKKGLVDESGKPKPGIKAEIPAEAMKGSSD